MSRAPASGRRGERAYHREADRRLTPKQRERRDDLKRRSRTAIEEREWRVMSYLSDVGDPDRALQVATRFAVAQYAINFDCNQALNEEEKRTVEADLLASCRALDVPVLIVHGSHDPRPLTALDALVSALPRVELVVMDGVSHLPWLEDQASFGRIAREFVAGQG